MSIERELLIRAKVLIECLNTKPLQDQADIILSEIKELLAQPEQDQEPVAWIIETHDSIKEPIPLYLAPPKREPLSDEEVIAKYRDIALELDNPLYVPSYYAGFRDAEKAHGIGVDDE